MPNTTLKRWNGTAWVELLLTPAPHTHNATDITAGILATARLGTGTQDATTFLRGDGTWSSPLGETSTTAFAGSRGLALEGIVNTANQVNTGVIVWNSSTGKFESSNTLTKVSDKLAVGNGSPTERLEVFGNAKAEIFISTQATGTAPFTVASTTAVTNLNADLLDGNHGAYYASVEYVNEVAQGLKAAPAAEIATTANLSATYSNGPNNDGIGATLTSTTNEAFPTIDGYTLTSTVLGLSGVLVKNQTNAAHNGRYNLTQQGTASLPWILTKCVVCDESDEIPGSYVFVKHGTLYASTGWVASVSNQATFIVGTDAINYFQFSGAGTYTANDGVKLEGTVFSADTTVVRTSGDQTISGVKTFNSIPVFNGGTSGSTAPFTVDSTQVVTNLNSDQLDGQHGSYYLDTSSSSQQKIGKLAIGSGTVLSDARLHVLNDTNFGIVLENTSTSASIYNNLIFKNNAGNQFATSIGQSTETSLGVANKFYLFDVTSSAVRYVVDSVGNMGIGTTSPAEILHIKKSETLGSTANNFVNLTRLNGVSANQFLINDYLVRESNGGDWETTSYVRGISIDNSFLTPNSSLRSWIKQNPSANSVQFGSASSTYLTINPSGLGIGTISPTAKLHVVGNTILNGDVKLQDNIISIGDNQSSSSAIGFTSDTITDITSAITNYVGNGTTTVTLTLGSSNSGYFPGLVEISGAVGTEQSKLNGRWRITSAPGSPGTQLTFVINQALASGTYTTGLGNINSVRQKFFGIDNNNSFSLIGQVDIDGDNISGNRGAIHTTTVVNYGSLLGLSLYNTAGDIRITNASENNHVIIATNEIERIRITNTGNIGIGTDTPSAKLDVAGDIEHTGLTMTSGTNVDQLKETTFTSALTTAWTDVTGVSGTYLATGSHIVQIISNGEYYTGTMAWFSGTTTSTTADEIVLHRAGPAASAGRIFARVIRTSSAPSTLKLQVSGSDTISSHTMTFKFRRTI